MEKPNINKRKSIIYNQKYTNMNISNSSLKAIIIGYYNSLKVKIMLFRYYKKSSFRIS